MVHQIKKRIDVNAPVTECYRIWSDFENLPRFMKNVLRVQRHGNIEEAWHWVLKGPFGTTLECDVRIDSMLPNNAISWSSLPESDIATSGTVNFQPEPEGGTRISYAGAYEAPMGELGTLVADFIENPGEIIDISLVNFKKLVEGEAYEEDLGIGPVVQNRF